MSPNRTSEREVELMFEILDFARKHGRKITEDQKRIFHREKVQSAFQKLRIGEYHKKVDREDFPTFYALTSRGLEIVDFFIEHRN